MKSRFFVLFIFVLNMHIASGQDFLFDNGKSDYAIVLAPDASKTEIKAAEELQYYTMKISGVKLPLIKQDTRPTKQIVIGWTPQTGVVRPAADYQGFRYFTSNGTLYIYGGAEKGTLYGVFSFLEQELGVRWYTSEYTKIPKKTSYILPALDKKEQPFITRRLELYYDALHNRKWCAYNKLNDVNAVEENEYGKYSSLWGIHTFFQLLPPSTYFKEHPEYYSLQQGKRIDNGQLCLSNKKMRKELVNRLLTTIEENPEHWCYDVSQNDNSYYCQCKACTKIAKRYGGQSGLMIWFVNKVAKEVKKKHPDVMLSTFAYTYTRHVPKKIKPAKNVVVRLCDIECCFGHALNDTNCEQNKDFMQDLEDWSKLTDRIYVWDYVTDFMEYLTPYPNFNVLAENIRTFGNKGVMGLLEEGSYDSPWSEFSELRQWVISKLLWNPYANTDSLVKTFCTDYYGIAAPEVISYWKSIQQQIGINTHIHFNSRAKDLWYTDEFVEVSIQKIEKALKKCSNDKITTKRVKRVLAQMYFVYVCRHYAKSMVNGRYNSLKKIIEDDPTIVKENNFSLDKYLKASGYT